MHSQPVMDKREASVCTEFEAQRTRVGEIVIISICRERFVWSSNVSILIHSTLMEEQQ